MLHQDDIISFLDGLVDRRRGTMHNKSEIDVISVFKDIILNEQSDKIPTDETSIQDIIAIVLNKMLPKYQVTSARSSGRNLVTYYKIQEESKISKNLQKVIKHHLHNAIEKVIKSPHN